MVRRKIPADAGRVKKRSAPGTIGAAAGRRALRRHIGAAAFAFDEILGGKIARGIVAASLAGVAAAIHFRVQRAADLVDSPSVFPAVPHDQEYQRQQQQLTWAEPKHADRKSTRLNSSHHGISYAVFCLKKTEHTNVLQSPWHHVWRLLLETKRRGVS